MIEVAGCDAVARWRVHATLDSMDPELYVAWRSHDPRDRRAGYRMFYLVVPGVAAFG
jgi:hypothetical protein